MMICFLGSMLWVAMLEISIKLSPSPSIEQSTRCIKLLSKVCVEQRLETLVYACDKAHIY